MSSGTESTAPNANAGFLAVRYANGQTFPPRESDLALIAACIAAAGAYHATTEVAPEDVVAAARLMFAAACAKPWSRT